jgi:hypothetical protein
MMGYSNIPSGAEALRYGPEANSGEAPNLSPGSAQMKNAGKTLLALMAIAATLGTLWYTNRVVIPQKATWKDVLNEARLGGYQIIETDELWQRYQKGPKNILLVDTRQEWEYRTGHIKGAMNFPMEPTGWSRWRNKGALESFLGPDKNRLIVFY